MALGICVSSKAKRARLQKILKEKVGKIKTARAKSRMYTGAGRNTEDERVALNLI